MSLGRGMGRSVGRWRASLLVDVVEDGKWVMREVRSWREAD